MPSNSNRDEAYLSHHDVCLTCKSAVLQMFCKCIMIWTIFHVSLYSAFREAMTEWLKRCDLEPRLHELPGSNPTLQQQFFVYSWMVWNHSHIAHNLDFIILGWKKHLGSSMDQRIATINLSLALLRARLSKRSLKQPNAITWQTHA